MSTAVPVTGPVTSVVPPPPDPRDCAIFELPQGTIIHRVHDSRFAAAEFNPGEGSSRFAPFAVHGVYVPTAYAATSFDAALFESLFHDIEPSAPRKSISFSKIAALHYSTLRIARTLRLAALFSADLMKHGLARNQLIDTLPATYRETRAWSPAIYKAAERPDGMIWVSRRYDEEKALMLFGDRVTPREIWTLTSVNMATDVDCLTQIHDLAKRAGVLIAR